MFYLLRLFETSFLWLLVNRWQCLEAALQRCSYKKVFWKYAQENARKGDVQENARAKVWFLLKSYFGMAVLL